jgi:hypothetical protein
MPPSALPTPHSLVSADIALHPTPTPIPQTLITTTALTSTTLPTSFFPSPFLSTPPFPSLDYTTPPLSSPPFISPPLSSLTAPPPRAPREPLIHPHLGSAEAPGAVRTPRGVRLRSQATRSLRLIEHSQLQEHKPDPLTRCQTAGELDGGCGRDRRRWRGRWGGGGDG